MFKKRIAIVIWTTILGFFFLQRHNQIVYACEPGEVENYWYRQDYEFNSQQFPEGVAIDVVYDYSVIGEFFFSNTNNEELYLILTRRFVEQQLRSLGENGEVAPDIIREYGYQLAITAESDEYTWDNLFLAKDLIPTYLSKNQQSAGGVKGEVPDPQRLDLFLVSEGILYTVPFTITYSINDSYDPNMVVPPSSVKERTIASTAVIEGIAYAQTNEVQHDSIYGTAEVTVRRWFKGSGPAVIKVNSFGSSDCEPELPPDRPMIMFLGTELRENHYSLLNTYGYYNEQIVTPNYAQQIIDTLGYAPVEVVSGEPLSDTLIVEQIEGNKTLFSSDAEELAQTSTQTNSDGSGLGQNQVVVGIMIGGAIFVIGLIIVFGRNWWLQILEKK